ncbi:2-hydroxyacid dehydrogenase [Virgibacillus xinjiangensis]|uniref:2-hydroxyacid dehydrogenase n=1 Tax=Virgibacillus xinjiangensis TaxID=393090 RepID=A0ABV7CWB0_9BACI
MKPKIILYNQIKKELVAELQAYSEVYQLSKEHPSFLQELQTAEGIIGSGLKVDEELLDQALLLRIISNISVGYDNLDMKELTNRGIMATNTPDVLTETTADTVFGLIMAVARRMPELDAYVKAGHWKEKLTKDQFGIDIHHKTLGIIGMGRIGKAVAERARYGFKMNIIYHNRSRNVPAEEELDAEFTSLDELLANADYVCLLAPLSPDTINLIGKREFKLMKESAIFINGARGAMVVEEDLADALANGEIRAAGVDVYREEPLDAKSPLLRLKNIVTLPHIGSATEETRDKMAELAVRNLITGLKGERPPCLINNEVLVTERQGE